MAAEISGAGATFPYPIYAKWAAAYKGATGVGLNYQSIGSGGGIAQIKAKTVTFGATDMPLKPKELDAAGLVMFPDGDRRGGDGLQFARASHRTHSFSTARPLPTSIWAKWRNGTIRRSRELNPSLNLPDKPIAVVHRSDGSGTTFIFANYLGEGEQGVG